MANGIRKCANCGADNGLHHALTDQCPAGGVEAPVGKKQEWKTSVFAEVVEPTPRTGSTDGDRSAFAHPYRSSDGEIYHDVDTGLTKREYFAAMAMQGLLASEVQAGREEFAESSVKMADLLIAALNAD